MDVYRSTRREVRLHPSLGEEIHLLHRVFRMYDNDNKNHLSVNEVRGVALAIVGHVISITGHMVCVASIMIYSFSCELCS